MGLKMVLELEQMFEPEIATEVYEERVKELNRRAFSAKEFEFDKVMKSIYVAPEGYYTTDPQPIYDGERWHLFYVTGITEYADIWIQEFRKGNFAAASKNPYEEVGDAHAVGDTLFDLKYHGKTMTEPQGEFSSLLQGDGFAAKYKDEWVYVVSNRGPEGQSMGLATSPDLYEWKMDPGNPFWKPPAYASRGKCAGAYIVQYGDQYLIYYMLTGSLPINGVGLLSTSNFRDFHDHGMVFMAPTQIRGTSVVESPCVVHRNGVWHLFFGNGTGWWHVMSDRPDNFFGKTDLRRAVLNGMYNMGPFHACRVLQTKDDKWYMCSTYKEEHRRLNREAGIVAGRGSKEDEASLLKGIYLAQLEWDGDFPVLLEW